MKIANVSLSRAHKIVKRINSEISDTTEQIGRLLVPVRVYVANDVSNVNERNIQIEKLNEHLDALYVALKSARSTIAIANSAENIVELLFEKSDLAKQYGTIAGFTVLYRDGIDQQSVEECLERLERASSPQPVYVNVLSSTCLEVYHEKLRNIKKRQNEISDTIHNIKTNTNVSIEFEDDIAELIGIQ